jgi:hypothetical protein
VHLFAGTHDDNMADMVAKGRQAAGLRQGRHLHPESVPVGQRNGLARLTDHAVVQIREWFAAGGTTQAELADIFGVRQGTIGKVVRGETWTHIAGPITRRGSRWRMGA